MTNFIEDYLQDNIKCIQKIKNDFIPKINEIQKILLNARDNGKNIFIFGNGGSASTASHFTADLLKTSLVIQQKKMKVICLSDNIPVFSAWANDISYDMVFAKQLENFLQKEDIVIGITGSGNSANVINAFKYAKKNEVTTIGLIGKKGGELKEISDFSIIVPSEDMLTIETMHLLICHLITKIFRNNGEPVFQY